MPKGKITSTYDYLLDDPDFRRWFDNVRRGSVVTAHHWLRRIGYIHKRFGKTPRQIAAMSQKKATDFLLDIVGALEKENKSGGYISNCIKPLKSWLQFNSIVIQQRIKIQGRDEQSLQDLRTQSESVNYLPSSLSVAYSF